MTKQHHAANGHSLAKPNRLAVLVIAAVLLLSSSAFELSRVDAATDGSGPLKVSTVDNFDRTVARGWGSAGGDQLYHPVGDSSLFSTAGGKGRFDNLAAGSGASVYLSVPTPDARVQVDLTIPQVAEGKLGDYLSLDLRHDGRGNAYRTTVYLAPSGQTTIMLRRVVGNIENTIAYVPGPRVAPGENYQFALEATGTDPVKLSAKFYALGSADPGWQLTTTDSGASRFTSAGQAGIVAYVSHSSVSTTMLFDNLELATRSTPPVQPPTQPPTPPPTPPTPVSQGSAAVGTTSYPIPAGSLFVNPTSGNDAASGTIATPLRTVAKAVNVGRDGQTVVLRGGVYHELVVVARRVTIQAYPGESVWFDGSVPINGWTQRGATWVHSGWTTKFDHSLGFSVGDNDPRFLQPEYPMAAHPDQVFVDGTQLRQVSDASAVVPGTFAVDYASGSIVMGTNPAGREIRASDLTQALRANIPGVILRGFGVRRYGTPISSMGSIRFNEAGVIENVVINDSATVGLSVSKTNNRINRISIFNSGMLGIQANSADDLSLTNLVIEGSNREHFNPWTAAGGIKVTRSRTISVSNSTVSNSAGTGIWFDESCVGINVIGNSVIGNSEAGIELELSDTAIVANNEIIGSKSGIYLFNTGNVRIFNNALQGQSDQGIWLSQNARRQSNPSDAGHDPRRPTPDPTVPWLLRNVTVANNLLGTGPKDRIYALDKQSNVPADSMNIAISGNLFAPSGTLVAWGGGANVIAARYSTVGQLSAMNPAWKNVESPSGSTLAQLKAKASGYNSSAVGFPADIAALVGVPAGTKVMGPLG